MSTRASDFEVEFSLPHAIEALGVAPKTDGAAEAWSAARANGYIFESRPQSPPIFLGSKCAEVVPVGLLRLFVPYSISVILETVRRLKDTERMNWWRRALRWQRGQKWEGSLGEMFATWCDVIRDQKFGQILATPLHFLVPQEEFGRLAFPVVVFVVMLWEAAQRGHLQLHTLEKEQIQKWRIVMWRSPRR